MKHLKTLQQFNESTEKLDVSGVIDSNDMTKKDQKDLDKLKSMYTLRDEQSKGGKRSCPYCNSRSWWQTSKGRQCNKCYKLF